VGSSTPRVSFFETATEKNNWIPSDLNNRYPSLNASAEIIPTRWSAMQLLGQLAQQRDADNTLQHITTDNVARDMLRITEAFGYDGGKLQYWGVS
jgi:hypothetical protein